MANWQTKSNYLRIQDNAVTFIRNYLLLLARRIALSERLPLNRRANPLHMHEPHLFMQCHVFTTSQSVESFVDNNRFKA